MTVASSAYAGTAASGQDACFELVAQVDLKGYIDRGDLEGALTYEAAIAPKIEQCARGEKDDGARQSLIEAAARNYATAGDLAIKASDPATVAIGYWQTSSRLYKELLDETRQNTSLGSYGDPAIREQIELQMTINADKLKKYAGATATSSH